MSLCSGKDGMMKMSNTINKTLKGHKHLTVLFLFLVFYYIANWVWLIHDSAIPTLDSYIHLISTLLFHDLTAHQATLYEFAALRADWANPMDELAYYPPLTYWLVLPFYYLFGVSEDIAVLVNFIFLSILVLSIYGLGSQIYNKNVGLLSAFFVAMFPLIFGMTRQFYLDFPLTAMVTLAIYLLIRTENFTNNKYSYLFGLSLGLGMLTKWTFLIFITGPLLYVFYRSGCINDLKKQKERLKQRLEQRSKRGLERGLEQEIKKIKTGAKTTRMPNNSKIFFGILKLGLKFKFVSALVIGFLLTSLWYFRNINNLFTDYNRYTEIAYPNLLYLVPLENFIRHPIIIFLISWCLLSALIYLILFVVKPSTSPNNRTNNSPSIINFISLISIALCVALVWYIPKIDVLHQIFKVAGPSLSENGQSFNYSAWDTFRLFYLPTILVFGTGILQQILVYLILFFIAFGIYLKKNTIKDALQAFGGAFGGAFGSAFGRGQFRRTKGSFKWILLLWFVAPYIFILTPMMNNQMKIQFYRFAMPVLPVLAIVFSQAVLNIQWERVKIVLVSVIILVSGLQFVVISFSIDEVEPLIYNEWSDPSPHWTKEASKIFINEPQVILDAKQEDWPILEILEYIRNDSDLYTGPDNVDRDNVDGGMNENQPGSGLHIGLFTSNRSTHITAFMYQVVLKKLPIEINAFVLNADLNYSIFFKSTYIVMITTSYREMVLMIEKIEEKQQVEHAMGNATKFNDVFINIDREFRFPDGNIVIIYKNIRIK